MDRNPAEEEETGYDGRAEGKAWCLPCGGEQAYRMEKIEFLGNPVKLSFFCLQCGSRIQPGATDAGSARRLRAEGRWLRVGAAGTLFLMLLFPILILLVLVGLLWRVF